MSIMGVALLDYVERACPDDLEMQTQLQTDIMNSRTALGTGEVLEVLSNPPGEFCNVCGLSVAFGSGRFVNRIPDFNEPEERKLMPRRFYGGDYVCAPCDGECDHVDADGDCIHVGESCPSCQTYIGDFPPAPDENRPWVTEND